MKNPSYSIECVRHSMAHVLAQAVKQEFPEAKLGFGPALEDGFYYDFDFCGSEISGEDLKRIEKRMKKILRSPQGLDFASTVCSAEEACKICEDLGEPYKKEYVGILEERGEKKFRFYGHGAFKDLCDGPHVSSTKDLPVDGFKLDRISGAYWLGDHSRAMLTRIYALCFATKEELQQHLRRREIARKFDHHLLGAKLGIFHFDDRVGKGLPLWLPAGTAIRAAIERYAEEVEFQYGYERVCTPSIAKDDLYRCSGHLQKYSESMFPPMVEEHSSGYTEKYYLRPMNCPHHHLIFGSKTRSYRDLPLRLAEYGDSFRFEQSGELSGLMRVRAMTVNDGHIYCARDQVAEEVRSILQMYQSFYHTFCITEEMYSFRLSMCASQEELRSSESEYQGSAEMWQEAQSILKDVLEELDISYSEGYGEAAFYGPKIDVQFRSLLGREETVSTIQLDFLAAQNFSLKFINALGQEEHPVVIHRAPLSTHERFIAFLLEYYGGAFPMWCSPVQVGIVPVHESVHAYCQSLLQELKSSGVRGRVALGAESFSKKIRTFMVQKVPLTVIIGTKEMENQDITYRRLGSKDNFALKHKEFLQLVHKEIHNREFPHFSAVCPSRPSYN